MIVLYVLPFQQPLPSTLERLFTATSCCNEQFVIDTRNLVGPIIRTEQDKSMNRDEGSCQLTHVCDKLFIAATSSHEQSFWSRQQRLLKW